MDPGAPLAAFIKESIIHWSTQHMKALGHMVSEKKIFFYVFPMTPPGRGPYEPQGHSWQIYKEDHYEGDRRSISTSGSKV